MVTQKFANFKGWTDVKPCEVMRVVSDKCLEIREMKCTLLNGPMSDEPDALQFEAGGFFGHTSGAQRWDIQPDESSKVFRIRLHSNGHWCDSGHQRYTLADEPHKYYDYNF